MWSGETSDSRLRQQRLRAPPARTALDCGALPDVILAITEQLSLSRFLKNLALAPQATTLRLAPEADAAAGELCD